MAVSSETKSLIKIYVLYSVAGFVCAGASLGMMDILTGITGIKVFGKLIWVYFAVVAMAIVASLWRLRLRRFHIRFFGMMIEVYLYSVAAYIYLGALRFPQVLSEPGRMIYYGFINPYHLAFVIWGLLTLVLFIASGLVMKRSRSG